MAVVQATGKLQVTNGVSTTATFNAASNFTAGNDAIFTAVCFPSSGITGVTIGGTAAVRDLKQTDGGNNAVEIWRATNMTGGTGNVVVTFGGTSGNYMTGSVEEWDNLAASPLDQTGTAGPGLSTAPSVTAAGATTQADEVVYAVYLDYVGSNATSIAPPSTSTEVWEELDGSAQEAGSGAYRILSAIGTPTMTFSLGASVNWYAILATYKLSAGGGPVVRRMMLMGAG